MTYTELFNTCWKKGDKVYIVVHKPLDLGPTSTFLESWPYKVMEGYVTEIEGHNYSTWSSINLTVHSDEFKGNVDKCTNKNFMYEDTVLSCMIKHGSYSDNFKCGRLSKFLTKEEADTYLIKAQKQVKNKIEKKKKELEQRKRFIIAQTNNEIKDIDKSLEKISKLSI